jgi:hypothetical protein
MMAKLVVRLRMTCPEKKRHVTNLKLVIHRQKFCQK